LEIHIRIEEPIDKELFQSFEPLFDYLRAQSIFCKTDNYNSLYQFSFHRLALENVKIKKSIFYKSENITHILFGLNPKAVIDFNTLFEPLKKIDLPFKWNTILWVHQLKFVNEHDFLKVWSRFAFQSKEWHLVDTELSKYLKDLKYKQHFWNVAIEETYEIISPLLFGIYNGLIAYEWIESSNNIITACPLHGRVKELEGMGIINPIASILAICAIINIENQVLAKKISSVVLHTYFTDTENTTPDRGGILNTSTYIRKLVEKLSL
jgi:hypothetical protein